MRGIGRGAHRGPMTQPEHEWHRRTGAYQSDREVYVCLKCGVIRRADGQNKPCRGVVKVKLR